ncbi:hypothetical protein E4U02_07530 [Microbacterium paludicola]|uniref:Uncharacterized protein n=1 Tax=Microbacterium paludicola TaxID=300019 RepID=A0A4Y9FVP7_9MICO|nr:hypothetical protein [Microbacterium paludicola]MBF0816256.1 hypothetical protein [Microbacterium paludicola]TFU33059.1 hypothetical protein E4U02_07530 [Microbacterium paludicola]
MTARTPAQTSSTGYRSQAYYIHNENTHQRLKAAWWWTREEEGSSGSLSALVERLMIAEAERLESLHNDGERFPPAPEDARGVDRDGVARQAAAIRQQRRQRPTD